MKTTAIIYWSFLDKTNDYANWLSEEVHGDLYDGRKIDIKVLKNYQRIILMSTNYFSWMPASSFLERNWDKLKTKNIVLLAVGKKKDIDYWTHQAYINLPENIRKKIHFYKMHNKSLFNSSSFKPNKDQEKSEENIRRMASDL